MHVLFCSSPCLREFVEINLWYHFIDFDDKIINNKTLYYATYCEFNDVGTGVGYTTYKY